MLDLDDAAIIEALNLGDQISLDLTEPQKSIVLAQLASARTAAIGATRRLINADPFDTKAVMRAQNDVRRFRSLVVWLRNAQTRTAEAFALLPPEDREEIQKFTTLKYEINDA